MQDRIVREQIAMAAKIVMSEGTGSSDASSSSEPLPDPIIVFNPDPLTNLGMYLRKAEGLNQLLTYLSVDGSVESRQLIQSTRDLLNAFQQEKAKTRFFNTKLHAEILIVCLNLMRNPTCLDHFNHLVRLTNLQQQLKKENPYGCQNPKATATAFAIMLSLELISSALLIYQAVAEHLIDKKISPLTQGALITATVCLFSTASCAFNLYLMSKPSKEHVALANFKSSIESVHKKQLGWLYQTGSEKRQPSDVIIEITAQKSPSPA